MQSVFLDHDICKWLQSIGVLGHQQQLKANGKLELDKQLSQQFMNGYKFGDLIQKIVQFRQSQGENTPMVPSIDSLKDTMTPGVRLFNWNLVSDTLQKIGFPFDQDIKALLVQGDYEMVNEVLRDLMDTENSRQERVSRVSGRSGPTRDNTKTKLQLKPPTPKTPILKDDDNGKVAMGDVDINKPLAETTSMLEFFLIGLCRNLSLTPKQSASLLSNGNKYLAHVVVKGVKNEFNPIISWMSEIYANLNRVFQLMNQSELNISIFLSTIKPGLLSKNVEVSLWTLRTYSKVLFELANLELHPQAYEWFTREFGGLSACFLCLKRHSQLVEQVCDVLVQACRFNTNDFFSVQFRKILDQGREYLEMINTLMEPLTQTKSMKEDVLKIYLYIVQLLNTGLIKYWAELALKHADGQSPEAKATAIRYLTLNWLLYPIYFEEEQNLPNQYMFLAKRATRERSTSLRYISLHCLFRLLEHFANERNPFAAVIYKKLTFSLIENFEDLETRDYMEANFINLFKKFSSVPIDILLEPLIKQCHVSDNKTSMNLCDMNILFKCCSHPKMTLRLSLSLLDLMSKVYLNDAIMSQLSFQQIQVLLSRYMDNEPVQEYAFKLARVCASSYLVSVSSKRDNPKINNPAFLSELQAQNNEYGIMQAQKRSQIVELLKFIINLNQASLNTQLKPLIVHFYLEIKEQLNEEDKGMLTLLFLLGRPEDIISQVQEQWDRERTMKEKELEHSMLKEQLEQEFKGNEFSDDVVYKSNAYIPDDPFAQLRDDEDRQEQQFLKQNGLGVKQKIVDKDREVANLKSKRPPQNVDPKVLDSLASIRLKKEELELNKKVDQEEKLKRELQLKKQAQHDIAKRFAQKLCLEIIMETFNQCIPNDEPIQRVRKRNESEPRRQEQNSVKRLNGKKPNDEEDVGDTRKRDTSQKKKIINRALEDKQKLKDDQDLQKHEQDEKYRRHQDRVRVEYQKMKQDRDRDDTIKKDEERHMEIQKADNIKTQLDQKKKYAVDTKQKLQDYKGKIEDEKKKNELVDLEEAKIKEEAKRKEHDQMKKKQHIEVQKMIEDKKKEFKDKGDKEKKKEKKQENEIQDWKNSVQGMLKEEQDGRQREKESQNKIHQMMLDPSYQEVFKRHEKSLQIVYAAYQEYSEWKIDSAEVEKNLLQFKGFTQFASQFNIYPGVISTEQSQLVFHSIAREREKQYSSEANGFYGTSPNGMNFQEFEQALLRITIKGQKAFDLIAAKHSNETKTIDMINMVKESNKLRQEEEQKIQSKKPKLEEDLYQQVDSTTSKTLEGLILYLDIDLDKSELLSKLRALKLEYQKVVAPRDKRRALDQKTEEPDVPKKRIVSANRKLINAPKKPKIKNKEENKKDESLAEIDIKDMDAKTNVGVIGPEGHKETWQVKQ